MNDDDDRDILFKVIVLGDSGYFNKKNYLFNFKDIIKSLFDCD